MRERERERERERGVIAFFGYSTPYLWDALKILLIDNVMDGTIIIY